MLLYTQDKGHWGLVGLHSSSPLHRTLDKKSLHSPLQSPRAYEGPWLSQIPKHPGPGGRVRLGYFSEWDPASIGILHRVEPRGVGVCCPVNSQRAQGCSGSWLSQNNGVLLILRELETLAFLAYIW